MANKKSNFSENAVNLKSKKTKIDKNSQQNAVNSKSVNFNKNNLRQKNADLNSANSSEKNSQKENLKSKKIIKSTQIKSSKNSQNLKSSNAEIQKTKKNQNSKNSQKRNSSHSLNSQISHSNLQQAQTKTLFPKISQTQTPSKKLNLLDFTSADLEKILSPDYPKFRVKQIFEWIYQKYADDFSQMSSLPKEMRAELGEKFHFAPLKCVKFEQSIDGSVKYLFALNDGLLIESVLLPMKPEQKDDSGKVLKHARYTICLSSQVGCKSGCAFCLTAKGGFRRNLTAGEIVAQVLWIKKQRQIPCQQRVNLVYMGMGEPLDNLTNVAQAVRIFAENSGLVISPKRQTISTSGLARQIRRLGEMRLGVLLAISLHAVTDELRSQLMPINKAYNIAAVMDAVRNFPIDTRKKVMFEYLLIAGVNDGLSHAKALMKLLCGIKAKVNLILFNPHEGSEFKRPSLENAVKFQDFLSAKGISCTIRQSKGLDISAACGQLKERTIR